MPLSLGLGSEVGSLFYGSVYSTGKADCSILRSRLSLPCLNETCQRICSHNTFDGHKLYFHVQNIQILSPNGEYWEWFLNYDNLIIKEKLSTHPTCNRETKIELLRATLNSKGERLGDAQQAHSNLNSSLAQTEGPSL